MTNTVPIDPPFDWADRYRRGDTPWDLGAAHPELLTRLDTDPRLQAGPGRRAAVPGCGRGHDALALADRGYLVIAIDLVDDLRGRLAGPLGQRGGQLMVTDALAYTPDAPFDLLWEHTFLSALAPTADAAYGRMARRLVAPGGHLAAIAFPADKPTAAGGPPFRTDAARLRAALAEAFVPVVDEPLTHPVARRTYAERWLLFERRRNAP